MREESSLAAPKQHYAGHPEPTNGSASIAADINGEHRIKISEKSPHMRGLQGRPDTQDGLAQRSDHVDLVAAAPHSEPRNTYGQAATKVASQRSQPQPRDTHYPPAGVVANPRRDPPAGYFGTHSRRDQLTAHTAHVQVQGRPYGKCRHCTRTTGQHCSSLSVWSRWRASLPPRCGEPAAADRARRA
ncbi:MAG: hypothetical protein VX747_08380, partial [Actinomycetota bacterium]|nr:hypothetical protein [Actinomycetota bacterium]